MKEIDCIGLSFPKAIRKVKKYFNSIGEGEALVKVDNETDNANIAKLAMSQGYQVEIKESQESFSIWIEKRGCLEVIDEKIFSILITSDKFGVDEKLGKILLDEYFSALSEATKLPQNVMFLNESVKIFADTSNNAERLDNIKLLSQEGVNILIHRGSLEYYKLNVSNNFTEIVDMYEIVDIINESTNLIKL
ncbi:sulfurtransferase-like selenium metabolism protein YedF [Clostridium uliginosum]|uniref:Selenium metabolism protein YedF n=1 Tax=Clostridium uliginosum TaxID=119641 RepID=A0A1I1IJ79_9CLOT|nr:sulfurtransferase-like selenium metabolism protein YedF [Clostridium uliginosum]SFC34248.1 selenium metabolism protein YedF [Clostridium uliginosum]